MHARVLTIAAIVSSVVLVGVAHAATLFSPVLHNFSSDLAFGCTVLNISGSTREVTFEIITQYGRVLSGPFTHTIPPGQAQSEYTTDKVSAYCKVDTHGVAKSNFRGHFYIYTYSNSDVHTLLSVPLE